MEFEGLNQFIFCDVLVMYAVRIDTLIESHPVNYLFIVVEGVAEEEEVDDQLLWNLQILSEVDFCF